MHADGPRAVGPHGKPVEASTGTTASDVGDIWKSVSKNLKEEAVHLDPWQARASSGMGSRLCAEAEGGKEGGGEEEAYD